jgi:hypothetical protein
MRWNSRVPEVENGVTSEQLLQPETRRKIPHEKFEKIFRNYPKAKDNSLYQPFRGRKNRRANGDPETQTRGRQKLNIAS